MTPDARPAGTTTIPDRRARRTALTTAVMAAACLVAPGTIAIIERPDNALEGYIAVGLGAAGIIWHVLLAIRAALIVTPDGIGRRWLRQRMIAWDDVDMVRFDVKTVLAGRHAHPRDLHHLHVDHDGRTTRLTRRPLYDADRDRLQEDLYHSGVRWRI